MALRKKPTRQIGPRAAGGHRGMLPLLCLSVCAAPAMAKGDAGEALVLEEIGVTSHAGDAPWRREVRPRSHSRDTQDLFRDEPAVEVGGGTPAARRLYLRGIESSSLNVSVDGARQGQDLFQHRGGITGIAPELLKRVEVQTLPSADQGAGALGGSIRFETVDAQDLLEPGRDWGALVRGGLSTVDQGYRHGVTAFGETSGGLGMLVNHSRILFDPYEDGDGRAVTGSEGEVENLFAKASLLHESGHRLRLSAERLRDEGLYTGDWAYDGGARAPTHQVSQRESYVLDHRYAAPGQDLIHWRANLYQNEQTLELWGHRMESKGQGVDLRNVFHMEMGSVHNALTVGASLDREEGRQTALSGGGDSARVDLENRGLYLQNRLTAGRWHLSLGVRHDDFDTRFGDVRLSGAELSPNLGAEVDLGRGFSAFAGYGEATRGTGTVPIGWLADTVPGAGVNQRPDKPRYGEDLQPERSRTRELGGRFEGRGLLRTGDHLHMQVSFFDTEIEDWIVAEGGRRGEPVTGFFNDEGIQSEGHEIRAGWGLGGFETRLGYLHAKTRNDRGEAVGFSRRKGVSLGDRLTWGSTWSLHEDLRLGYTLQWVDAVHREDVERDGYQVHDVQLQWRPGFARRLELQLAVNNLLDAQYSSQASAGTDTEAAPEPGRDVRLTARYRF